VTSVFHILRAIILALFAPRTTLLAENLLLRQQVILLRRAVARPRVRPFDRWLLATLAGGFRALLAVIVVVKPATVIAWHRAGWRLIWLAFSPTTRPAAYRCRSPGSHQANVARQPCVGRRSHRG
jgi:hypothetical protein